MKEEYLSHDEKRDCCSRNGLSICLSVWLIISLASLGFVSYFLIKYHIDAATEEACTDIQCVKSASEIDEFIDTENDPCNNFFGFVCGKFMKTAYEKQLKHPLGFEFTRLENKINSYIVEPISDRDIPQVQMQKRYFRSCLREERVDENNTAVFFRIFNEIGGWPFLAEEKWSERKEISFDWTNIMIKAMYLGLPFDWFLNVDLYDNGHYILKIARPKRCNKISSQKFRSPLTPIITSFTSHNISKMDQIYDIISLEEHLTNICHSVKDENISVKNIFEFAKIWFTRSKCLPFINAITGDNKKWQLYSEIAYDEPYILKLKDLLANTTKEALANYIGWKIIESFAPYLSEPIREKFMKFIKEMSEEDIDRFQFCLEDTKEKFDLVSETMYIREYTNPVIKEAGEKMVNSINDALQEQIKNNDWMTNNTKIAYLEYYNDLKIIVGGPEQIFNNEIFNKYLHIGELSFSSHNIIKMITSWHQKTFLAKMRLIGQHSESPLLNFAYTANRGFGILLNMDQKAIILPATMLHGVMFDIDRPQYLNYGSLGILIAKKLVEGLETAFNETSYINANTEECLKRSINMLNTYIDVSSIVRSNSGDLVGRHIAYSAYQKFVEENGEEAPLIGLPFSPNELFWIKSSINWCHQDLENPNPFFQNMLRHRIIETAKNSPHFGEDFKCPDGSKMNPQKKCTIV